MAYRFYAYVLYTEDGAPCYVGKGVGGRLWDHKDRPDIPDTWIARRIPCPSERAALELEAVLYQRFVGEGHTLLNRRALVPTGVPFLEPDAGDIDHVDLRKTVQSTFAGWRASDDVISMKVRCRRTGGHTTVRDFYKYAEDLLRDMGVNLDARRLAPCTRTEDIPFRGIDAAARQVVVFLHDAVSRRLPGYPPQLDVELMTNLARFCEWWIERKQQAVIRLRRSYSLERVAVMLGVATDKQACKAEEQERWALNHLAELVRGLPNPECTA